MSYVYSMVADDYTFREAIPHANAKALKRKCIITSSTRQFIAPQTLTGF